MPAALAWIVLFGIVQAPDPAGLVRQLGSARYSEREQAAAELERMGRDALAALVAARQDRDPEVRDRAGALHAKIEGALLTRATPVTLDFQDVPLGDALRSVFQRTGLAVALVENNPAVAARRITAVESEPLPFWKAIDRICEAGQVQYNLGYQMTPGRVTALPLYDGRGVSGVPTVDTGPFRVNLASLHYTHDIHFGAAPNVAPFGGNRRGAPAPARPASPVGHSSNTMFSFHLNIAAEPRLMVQQNGPVKLLEAVDDLGQDLLPPDESGGMARFSGYVGYNSVPVLQLQVPLTRPEAPGKVIRKLRGVVPVTVSSRKPDPMVAPLAGASGKTFRGEDVQLTVASIRPQAGGAQTLIELHIRPAAPGNLDQDEIDAGTPRADLGNQQRIELVDAQGNALPWFISNSRLDPEGARLTLVLPTNGQAPPAQLRYYAMTLAGSDVAFEFRDLPMP